MPRRRSAHALELHDAQAAGAVTMNYGMFINNTVAFLIVALAMFGIIRLINRLNEEMENQFGDQKPEPQQARTEKKCPFCLTTVPFQAVRCPACTSELKIPAAGKKGEVRVEQAKAQPMAAAD